MTTPAEIGFDAERFEVLKGFSEDHFWFAGRMALVRKLLRAQVPRKLDRALDLGCGPGHWLPQWLEFANTVCGVDPFIAAVEPTEPQHIETMQGSVHAVPAKDHAADLVLMLDVLEHVDDHRAMAEVTRVLKPGGIFLATVPALPWLWSTRDTEAGHLRRYTARTLRALFEHHGLKIEALQYYQGLLMPAVLLSRLAGRGDSAARDTEDTPPAWLNTLFRSINLFEVNCGLRPPIGSSLVAIARVPE